MWPELRKAKDTARKIEAEFDSLLKNHSSFGRKEIARQTDTLIAETETVFEKIEEEMLIMRQNMENHRKYLDSKARFLKRHYKNL